MVRRGVAIGASAGALVGFLAEKLGRVKAGLLKMNKTVEKMWINLWESLWEKCGIFGGKVGLLMFEGGKVEFCTKLFKSFTQKICSILPLLGRRFSTLST